MSRLEQERQQVEHAHHDQQVAVAGQQRGVLEAATDDGAQEVDPERRLRVVGLRNRLAKAMLAR